MKLSIPLSVALFTAIAVFGADDAEVSQPLTIIRAPKGIPKFAIVARIEDDGRRVTIGQFEHCAGSTTVPLDQPEVEAHAYTIGGQQLEPSTLHKRLSEDSVVLISTDGNFPSREYTQYLKPRTIVFVFKTGSVFSPQNQQLIRLKLAANKKLDVDR